MSSPSKPPPPLRLIEGACTCDVATKSCVCAPADFMKTMEASRDSYWASKAAEERGDHAEAARHRADHKRLDELCAKALEPVPYGEQTMNRSDAIDQIEGMLSTLGRLDASEQLNTKSDAYLVARRDSLAELVAERASRRDEALTRQDAAAAIRLDAKVDHRDLISARMQVLNSDVAPADRESIVERIAYRSAWIRSRDNFVGNEAQRRIAASRSDSAPSDDDVRMARRELAGRAPLGTSARTDGSDVCHEAAVSKRASQIAEVRRHAEVKASIERGLPDAPAMPRLGRR